MPFASSRSCATRGDSCRSTRRRPSVRSTTRSICGAVPPSPTSPTEASLRSEAARLDDLRLAALEERIEAQLTVGELGEVIGELESLTARHPLRERFWEQLMLALYRDRASGRGAGRLSARPGDPGRRARDRSLARAPQAARADPRPEPRPGSAVESRCAATGCSNASTRTRSASSTGRSSRTSGRDVAVRVVHEHRANDPAFVRRFEPEAQAVAALEHPHVAPIYDYWREPGRAYVVTRFLRGGSLRELSIDSDAVPHERATRILEQVASALAFAHRRGVAHGDAPLVERALRRGGQRLPRGLLHRERLGGSPRTTSTRSPPWRARRSASASRWTSVRRSVARRSRRHPTTTRRSSPSSPRSWGRGPTAGRPSSPGPRNPYKGLRPFLEADALDFFGEGSVHPAAARSPFQHRSGVEVHRRRRARAGAGSPRWSGPVWWRRSAAARSQAPTTWFVTEMHPGHHPLEELDDRAHAGRRASPRGSPRSPRVGTQRSPGGGRCDPPRRHRAPGDRRSVRGDLHAHRERGRPGAVPREPSRRDRRPDEPGAGHRRRFGPTSTTGRSAIPGCGELLGSSTEVLSPLTPEELERAIVRPAEQSGLQRRPGARRRRWRRTSRSSPAPCRSSSTRSPSSTIDATTDASPSRPIVRSGASAVPSPQARSTSTRRDAEQGVRRFGSSSCDS